MKRDDRREMFRALSRGRRDDESRAERSALHKREPPAA
jgi:hypothetical protein